MSRRIALTIIAVAAAAIAIGVAGAALGVTPDPLYGDSAPGVVAPVGGSDQLAVATDAPSAVVSAVQRMATITGGDGAEAVSTLREVRTNLGHDHASIYSFKPDGRATCLILSGRASTCPSPGNATPGVVWMISGGYSAWARPDGVAVPSALVGIAADNVRDVSVVKNGSAHPLSIENNAFYTEVADDSADAPVQSSGAGLRVTYDSGQTITVPLPVG